MLEYLIFAATVILFLIFAVIYLYPGAKKATTIPGPEPVDPLEGNIPDIASCGGLHFFLAQIHEDYGPVASFWLGPKMYVSIAKANLFEEQASIFDRAGDLYSYLLPLIGEESIQYANGAEGRRRHAMYAKCFTQTAIKPYFSVFNEQSRLTVEKWRTWTEEEYIPVREHMLELAVRMILGAAFGLSLDDQLVKRLRVCYDVCFTEVEQQFKGDYPEASSARMKRFNQCKEEMMEIIRQAVRRQKECSASAVDNQNIVAAALSLGLSESAVHADLLSVFIGGFHTTASLLTWTIYYLAAHPDIQERARKEALDVIGSAKEINADHTDQQVYLQQVVNETLRCATIAPFAAREQEVDCEIGGHRIPAGTPVIHALGVALHDPDVFPEPEKFDPERFSPENVSNLPRFAFEPFGFAGKRKCIGYRFSLAECMTFVAVLLRSNLHVALAPDQTVTAKAGLVMFPSEELWVTVEERKEESL